MTEDGAAMRPEDLGHVKAQGVPVAAERIDAVVQMTEDGRATVTVVSTYPVHGADVPDAYLHALEVVASHASRAGRRVEVKAHDPYGTWAFSVDPDGEMHPDYETGDGPS